MEFKTETRRERQKEKEKERNRIREEQRKKVSTQIRYCREIFALKYAYVCWIGI